MICSGDGRSEIGGEEACDGGGGGETGISETVDSSAKRFCSATGAPSRICYTNR